MLMSGRLRRLLLAGTCLCVCGTPVHLPSGSRGASGPAGGRRLLETWVGTASHRFQASSPEPPQLSFTAGEARDQREGGRAERDPETSPPSTPESPNPGTSGQRDASPSCGPPSASPLTSTRLSIWGRDEATSPLPEPVLPEIGPNLMPREDGPDSLWTEASRPSGGDTAAPPSQDEATEGTMSSEALPLIFEPFEDVTSEVAGPAAAPGGARPPGAAGTPRPEAGGPSDAPSLLMPDWTSPWQTSGGELLEPSAPPGPSASGAEGHSERGAARTPDASPSLSSFQPATTTVTVATRRPAHKSRSGLEEMESEEEDEDEENSEDSVEEDDSEEDQTGTPRAPSTRPPYGLVPPPPVWFQRNQGLMRSWVELIREKAGYVSGMLVPVGIGITGALLIVGALYSVRVIHRKRRNSFKHQRRKVRQQEQPREPGTGPQDQAMLLADSSEDEF